MGDGENWKCRGKVYNVWGEKALYLCYRRTPSKFLLYMYMHIFWEASEVLCNLMAFQKSLVLVNHVDPTSPLPSHGPPHLTLPAYIFNS